MNTAPSGRLFGAIATLSEMSAKASKALEEGSLAMDRGDDDKATVKLARALVHLDDMASAATPVPFAEEPAYLRKSR